jgi:hypothetical protein
MPQPAEITQFIFGQPLRRMQEVMTMIARRQGLLPPEEDEAV